MKAFSNKSTNKLRRQRQTLSILKESLAQSHLIKLQRMFLEHSSSPNKMYSNDLLLDYPNPALDPRRSEVLDEHFEVDYLLHNLYRKLVIPGVTPADELDRAAYRSFIKGERNNVRTNRRLRNIAFGDVEVNTMVWRIRNLIAQILGRLNYDKIVELSHFSSGATADLKRSQSTPQQKFAFRRPSVTISAAKFFAPYILKESFEATGLGYAVRLVDGNRVLTVPKSNSTNRTIAAEPTLNMYFQLGVGSYIRRRLRKFGINLNDQTINQELARQGSITGELATLDLENASNSVSYEVVKLLLPPEWFECLDVLRSPFGTVMGRLHRYRMFSSMGNGYTFELESLIFYAICKCSCKRGSTISVYGDDLIVPTADADNVIKWLRFFGFNTNVSKSFTSGRFRESCGKHYHSGVDVSPFFVRRIPKGTDLYLLFNNIGRWCSKSIGFDIRFAPIMEYVLSLIPLDSRIFGPDGYGDGHLLEVDSVTPKATLKYSRQLGACTFKSLVLTFNKKNADQKGALCASLLGHTKESSLSYVTDDLKKSYRLVRIQVQS